MFGIAGLLKLVKLVISSVFDFFGSVFKAIGGIAGVAAIVVSLLVFNWYHTKFVHPGILDEGKELGIKQERSVWEESEKKAKAEVEKKKLEAEIAVTEISKRHQIQIQSLQDTALSYAESIAEWKKNQALMEYAPTVVEVKDENGNVSKVSKCISSNAPVLDVNVVRQLNRLTVKPNGVSKQP